MRTKILAVVIFLLTVTLVSVNTYFLDRSIGEVISAVKELEIAENGSEAFERATEVKELYERRQSYISLSVSHNDLTEIESAFAELLGQLEVGELDGAKITKSRLVDALGHLRRLSGVNIDSVV